MPPFHLFVVLGVAVALVSPAGVLGVQVAEGPPQVGEDERPLPEPGDTLAARLQAPLIYVDCDRCDGAHIRREITFVNHVRDPGLAEVHVLVTDQPTGAGGRRYTLAFLGRDRFSDMDNTLTYHSLQSNTEAQERDGVTATLELGLVPYAARTPAPPRIRQLGHPEPGGTLGRRDVRRLHHPHTGQPEAPGDGDPGG